MTRPFYNARYWVGCSTESALYIMFSLNDVSYRQEEFSYIAAFDDLGAWVDEAKVEFYEENGEPYLNFEF